MLFGISMYKVLGSLGRYSPVVIELREKYARGKEDEATEGEVHKMMLFMYLLEGLGDLASWARSLLECNCKRMNVQRLV